MILTVIGTGSRGNGYVLRADDGEALILECGMRLQEYLPALGYDTQSVRGVFVTHSHQDHAGRVEEFLCRYMPVWMTKKESECIRWRHGLRPFRITKNEPIKAGGFTVVAFPTLHDTPDPVGFVAHHKESGNVLFLTDTERMNAKLPPLSHILIEVNHDAETIWDNVILGRTGYGYAKRASESHLSLKQALKILKRCKSPELRSVTIIHASELNSETPRYEGEIRTLLDDPSVTVSTAKRGLILDLNKEPF